MTHRRRAPRIERFKLRKKDNTHVHRHMDSAKHSLTWAHSQIPGQHGLVADRTHPLIGAAAEFQIRGQVVGVEMLALCAATGILDAATQERTLNRDIQLRYHAVVAVVSQKLGDRGHTPLPRLASFHRDAFDGLVDLKVPDAHTDVHTRMKIIPPLPPPLCALSQTHTYMGRAAPDNLDNNAESLADARDAQLVRASTHKIADLRWTPPFPALDPSRRHRRGDSAPVVLRAVLQHLRD